MPIRRRFRASVLTDHRADERAAQSTALPPELEARVAALESAPSGTSGADFDGSSWFWMLLLGIAIPAALLVVGWLA